MNYPIVIFLNNDSTYRVLIPDFDGLSFNCEDLDHAYSKAESIIIEQIHKLSSAEKDAPVATKREDYITRYLDAVLVSQVSIAL
ncbi:MAG: type II toxin-antitoxin system HicB family antitoxin [Gammaproteobacteria bacterium]|nr:type II toxin-antitoxin system HicB family antitoxin [Gammaproteobacteria bacterium]